MKKDRINRLIAELLRLSAEYSTEEFETGAKIIRRAVDTNKMEKMALLIADLGKEIDKSREAPSKKIEPIKIKGKIPRRTKNHDLERRFTWRLKKFATDKNRFKTTMSVRMLLKDLFGHEIGKRKDGRERIIKYAIREYNKLSTDKKLNIYRKLRFHTSSISTDFEGYSRIIRREENESINS